MRVFLLPCLVTILVSMGAAAETPDLKPLAKQYGGPVLWVPKPAAPPVLDGKLDDPCWKDVSPVTLGYSTGAWWDSPTQKTEAFVLADDKSVYFAVRCAEATPARLSTSGTARKGMVVGADAVEFFLDPGCRAKRGEYFHVIITPDGKVQTGRGVDGDWPAAVTARVDRRDDGWSVEAAVPLGDLGLKDGAVPRVWGLNICRQRPELGFDMPKAARAAGNKRYDPPMWKLDEPDAYRLAEYTAWSPTMADFCGWPFYADSRPFHVPQRFGHALFQIGTQEVTPPREKFEVIFRSDFDDGELGPFKGGAIVDDNFRGSGKCLTFANGQNRIQFTQPLEDLQDVTLILTLRLTEQRQPIQHLSLTGKAPDGIWCGAERYEFFLPPEEGAARTAYLEEYHKEKYGDGPFRLYDTHADMVRWKPCGRVARGPGPWAMVEGFFAEPSGGQVRWPGNDWVIVRIRPGLFRRAPGPKQGQKLVPAEQNYPDGLSIGATPRDGMRIDDVVVFRGVDSEPPQRVSAVKATTRGEDVELSWDKAKDNTLTAFYRLFAGQKLLLETHRLSASVPKSAIGNAPVTVVAVDLDGNASAPSEPAR